MLTVLFFLSVFSSLVWFIYAGLFVHARFQTVDMSSVDAYTLALYAGLVVIPVWIVWQVFGFINQYFKTKSTDKKLEQLYAQMKKNQDYTDLVVRVMLDAEHEIKDGFVVGKFDIFVADMNEILADIAQRANAASSVKMGELWSRVKNGERWVIAKTFIENAKAQSDFTGYLKDKAERDSVFKGTLLEFCARYQNLSDMLEKHDRDRHFITILQTGVMGKVYAMLSPIAFDMTAQDDAQKEPEKEPIQEQTFEVTPSIQSMQAPAEPTTAKSGSLMSKLNPFAKKKAKNSGEPDADDDDAFFATLQQRMKEPDELSDNTLSLDEAPLTEPHFEPQHHLNDAPSLPDDIEDDTNTNLDTLLNEPDMQDIETAQSDTSSSDETENLAYPFGGWTDDKA
ncbi:MAG: hypothetical protein J6X42_05540 [Alphaproteobacteria bacterium]|nr:hypothetical protein [Alphaproteobacteria bacterium]